MEGVDGRRSKKTKSRRERPKDPNQHRGIIGCCDSLGSSLDLTTVALLHSSDSNLCRITYHGQPIEL